MEIPYSNSHTFVYRTFALESPRNLFKTEIPRENSHEFRFKIFITTPKVCILIALHLIKIFNQVFRCLQFMGMWVLCRKDLTASLRHFQDPLMWLPLRPCFSPFGAVCSFTALLWLVSLGQSCSFQLSRSRTLDAPQGTILHTAN